MSVGTEHKLKVKIMPYVFVITAYSLLVITLYLVSASSVEHTMVTTSNLMAEKGSAIIRIFEGLARCMDDETYGSDLQNMFETLDRDNVLFATIVDSSGMIIAHNDSSLVGKPFHTDNHKAFAKALGSFGARGEISWAIWSLRGERVFAVYRHFYPQGNGLSMDNKLAPVMVVGLATGLYDKTHAKAVQNVMFRSLAIGLAALAGFFIIKLGLSLKESRLKHEEAEVKVRLLEEEVARKEKLAAIGTLASGVAHEIRNPLSSIMGYAYYFSQFFSEGSEERKYADTMGREVQRLNRVISDLLCFARPAGLILKPGNVPDIIEHALRLLLQEARKQHVEIVFTPPEGFPPVMLDADRFTQAFLNVCLNAIEAMPEGGVLTVKLAVFNKEYFSLEVRDTGTGISPAHMAMIFDPYFTTKVHGTGLGLPTVYKIVEAHGGQITVDSGLEVNGGTGVVFCFIIPFGKAS